MWPLKHMFEEVSAVLHLTPTWSICPSFFALLIFLPVLIKKGNTLRHVGRNVPGDKHKTIHCTSHLGVVSAIHLSSVAGKQIKTKIKTFHFYLHIMD